MKVHDDNGAELDATFSVEEVEGRWSVVLESRGGTRGAPSARNVDYIPGMEWLLRRMGRLGLLLVDAVLESTTVASQPLEKRRLVRHLSYPIALQEHDAVELGRKLRSAQGNNSTRRVRLYLEQSTTQRLQFRSARELEAWLSKGLPAAPYVADPMVDYGEFDVTSAVSAGDARERLHRSISVRQGQPQFRQELLKAYGERCAISGCDVVDVLEAAHILPYRGRHTNHVQNGLLLRADLHTLFDLGLISITTDTWAVIIAPRLRQTYYSGLEGQRLRLPENRSAWPSVEALWQHRKEAGL